MKGIESQGSGIVTHNICVPEADRNNNHLSSINNATNKAKKRGSFSLLKTALILMRRPKNDQKKKLAQPEIQGASKGKWKNIVGSMRPLHLQDNNSPPPSLPALSPSPSVENLEDLVNGDPSSCSPLSSSSGGTMSQYASTSNLQELDVPDDAGQDKIAYEVLDAICGDEMIDTKAEEFIAQFYQQMMLQHSADN